MGAPRSARVEHLALDRARLPPFWKPRAGDARGRLSRQQAETLGRFSPRTFIASMVTANFRKAWQTLALTQTRVNEALLACALERYRLANGQFPGTLDALNLKYVAAVPADVITGQSLKYRQTDDGQFQLYSVGWNEKDDGGKTGMNKEGDAPDYMLGDWVWPQYPDQ